jgi:hypothetical protein
MTLRGDTGDDGVELAEVDLRLLTGLMGLRHNDLDPRGAVFTPPAPHIARHRHLAQPGVVFGAEALPDPPRGMSLFTGNRFIGFQPGVDDVGPRPDRRLGT